MEGWATLTLTLAVIIAIAAVVISVISMRFAKSHGRRGTSGRRGRRGATGQTGAGADGVDGDTGPAGSTGPDSDGTGTTGFQGANGMAGMPGETGNVGPTGLRQDSISLIPYAAQLRDFGGGVFGFGRELGFALSFCFAGTDQAVRPLPSPVDPNTVFAVHQLNQACWANNGPATLRDLQVVLSPGTSTATGMTVFAQIWISPACNGTWTGMPLIASVDVQTGVPSGACFNSGLTEIGIGAGDRVALVIDTNTGTFLATDDTRSISAGLGYFRTI